MNLVIEDGTGVPGANSYVSADDLFVFAADRGITIPQDVGAVEALLIRAMDYIEMFSLRYSGAQTLLAQTLSFPRTASTLGGTLDLGVPENIRKAQMVAAIAAKDINLLPVPTQDPAVVQKTIGPLTIKYDDNQSRSPMASLPQVDTLLRPYFSGGFGQPIVVRG